MRVPLSVIPFLVGRMGECLKCGKAGQRVHTQALFYNCYLCIFALTPPANLLHFLICAHFWFNTLGLVFCFYWGPPLPQIPPWHPTESQKETDMKMNNCHNNFSGSNMYELWVIKWVCSKTCESQSDCPW